MALKDHILKLADGVSKCQENAKSLAQVIFRGLDDIADNLPEHPGGGSDVSVTQVLSSGTKTATITVDDTPTDLYAPDPTDVNVTQVHTSGTKIATITVDDTPTDLYAPTPSAPTDVDVTQVVSTGTKIATITVDNVPTDIYAPAGGSSQDYSTTPHIIGKWIDGTTDVYEVTYDVDNITFSGQSCTIDPNFTNKLVISYTGAVTASGGSANTALNGIPGIDNWEFGIHMASPALLLYAGKNASVLTLTGGRVIVTVRYINIT